jgi:hypothetical protein
MRDIPSRGHPLFYGIGRAILFVLRGNREQCLKLSMDIMYYIRKLES